MNRGFFFKMTAVVGMMMLMTTTFADARAGGGRSMGSRGSNTYSMPRSTPTAPSSGQSFDRSVMPAPSPSFNQPGGFGQRPMAPNSGFGMRNLMTGFGLGLLGSGLIGMMTGQGFFGGIGSMLGFLGFLIQMALVFFVVRWIYRRFIRRNDTAYAGGPLNRNTQGTGPMGGGLGGMMGGGMMGGGLGGMMGGSAAGGTAYAPASQSGPADQLGLSGQDFDQFERLLSRVEEAYSNEDLNALRTMATPEMVSYFAEDFAANQRAGRINRISNVKLLQGDLSEAWREGNDEYATVAMRFSLVDVTLDRATQRIVDGSPQPQQATELWTFRRSAGGPWQLSAIQQTN